MVTSAASIVQLFLPLALQPSKGNGREVLFRQQLVNFSEFELRNGESTPYSTENGERGLDVVSFCETPFFCTGICFNNKRYFSDAQVSMV